MNMTKTVMKSVILAALLFGGNAVMAEEKAPAPTMKQAPKKLKPLTPEAEKAAYKLFEALKMKEGIHNALMQSLALQIKRQPAMAPYADIYKDFFTRYTKWEDMKKQLAQYYATYFTPQEMEKLAKFYRSDLGKKTLTIMPRLTQVSMLIAQQRIAKHAKELKEAVAARAKELEAKASKNEK